MCVDKGGLGLVLSLGLGLVLGLGLGLVLNGPERSEGSGMLDTELAQT